MTTKKTATPKKRDFYPFNFMGALIEGNKVVLRTTKRLPGHYCGYVAFPKKSVPPEWHGNHDADGLQYLNIHGGLTYASVEGDWVIFGFDCAHAGDDKKPKLQKINHVMKLTKQMESQLKEYLKVLVEWRKASRKKRIEMMDVIRAKGKMESAQGLGIMIGLLSGGTEFGPEEWKGEKNEN